MNRRLAFLLFLLPSIGFCDCTPETIVQQLRPGAEWSISGRDIDTLVWMSTQTIPTKIEITTAISACQTDEAARKILKQQARLDVKNAGLTQAQRLQALLILLDYDR